MTDETHTLAALEEVGGLWEWTCSCREEATGYEGQAAAEVAFDAHTAEAGGPATDMTVLDDAEEYALRTEWCPGATIPPLPDNVEQAILAELDRLYWDAIKAEWARRGYTDVRRVAEPNRESYLAARDGRYYVTGRADTVELYGAVHEAAIWAVPADDVLNRHLHNRGTTPCQECGEPISDNDPSEFSPEHAASCSLNPANTAN